MADQKGNLGREYYIVSSILISLKRPTERSGACVLKTKWLTEMWRHCREVEARRGPEMYLLHIQTDVAYRFATTQVICRLANKSPEAKESVFVMTIPKTAFISSFVISNIKRWDDDDDVRIIRPPWIISKVKVVSVNSLGHFRRPVDDGRDPEVCFLYQATLISKDAPMDSDPVFRSSTV
ncbi:hypothetical protein LSH36_18g07033 [Paralvinella palmiformis]|uniref:VIT domain-containing protein n=1 Tax=Paralvinella palmiformis TaxID=53620 RepID=A0AAD9NFG9_9ANNE|nr:hypothetical protein LSH36_18g07033 [Paralvinella palmiformis]